MGQALDRSLDRSVTQSINQSINQSIARWRSIYCSIEWSLDLLLERLSLDLSTKKLTRTVLEHLWGMWISNASLGTRKLSLVSHESSSAITLSGLACKHVWRWILSKASWSDRSHFLLFVRPSVPMRPAVDHLTRSTAAPVHVQAGPPARPPILPFPRKCFAAFFV